MAGVTLVWCGLVDWIDRSVGTRNQHLYLYPPFAFIKQTVLTLWTLAEHMRGMSMSLTYKMICKFTCLATSFHFSLKLATCCAFLYI